ncbi:gamma-glutamylcyclotransferase [Myxococcus sp. CA033]|uniref:gamma-glutamylcyclotransferase n=1 Tax=Myxococcus sp. CA033 TaxID=2741516 RepID=UPI00157A6B2D|nr:gamma-glutamylcyclotransferase [Myxococcus sp. CA033]NTX36843.1 gamma-glutamylcyclotransferase [Myxococcus sp. CA033]
MDSHYDQVMKAREGADPNAKRLYFAYSTILDRAAFDEWKQQHSYGFFELPEGRLAEAVDVDLVYDFPSRWWGGRVAGLADATGGQVFGRLFEIRGQDWPIVQHKEGFVTGMCVERTVKVLVDGQEVEATAFVTNPRRAAQDGPVSPRFVEALVRGAQAAGLPADYVERLKRGGA